MEQDCFNIKTRDKNYQVAMVEEYPDSFENEEEYNEWLKLLYTNIRMDLEISETKPHSNELHEKIEEEVDEKLSQLAETRAPYRIIGLSEMFDPGFVQGNIRMAENEDEKALQMARNALINDLSNVFSDSSNMN